MMRRTVAGLSLLSMLVWGRIVPAAENALDAISTDASVVIRLKSPSATIDKVAELVNQVVPGAGEEIKKNADGIGFAISNPTLAGVDKSADWWVAVYASADRQEPGVVFV